MPWTTAELPSLRSAMGQSAALWARDVHVEPGRWKALSGVFSPRYNLVLCHGRGLLAESADELSAAGVPAIVMAAGAALAEAEELAGRGWVRVGEMPFMVLELGEVAPAADAGVRRLSGDELDAARGLIAEVFGLHDRLAVLTLPPDAAERPGQDVWGAFDHEGALVSCGISVAVGEYLAIWSLATERAQRRAGHAARLMRTALASAGEGLRASALYAPAAAEPFYRSLGYETLERWQLWSRPRWGFTRPLQRGGHGDPGGV